MKSVVGLDGTPGGWAAVFLSDGSLDIKRITFLQEFFADTSECEIIAIDIPIGLIDAYEIGGRVCDRAARGILGKRASSVFPAPVRPVLDGTSYAGACDISRSSGPLGKAITKQTFHILPKIREVDSLLAGRPGLRKIMREVHPEVSFRELTGSAMLNSKRKSAGRKERREALMKAFPKFEALEAKGRAQGLPVEDILDAAVACWSAYRIATGIGRSFPRDIPLDSCGLGMAIWV